MGVVFWCGAVEKGVGLVVNGVELVVGFTTVLWTDVKVVLTEVMVLVEAAGVVVPVFVGAVLTFGTVVMVVPMEAVVMVAAGVSAVVLYKVLVLLVTTLGVGCTVLELKRVDVEWMEYVMFSTPTEVDMLDGEWLVRDLASGVDVRGVVIGGVVERGGSLYVVIVGLLKFFSSSKGPSVGSSSANGIECTFLVVDDVLGNSVIPFCNYFRLW